MFNVIKQLMNMRNTTIFYEHFHRRIDPTFIILKVSKVLDLNDTHPHFIFCGLCDTIFISWKISRERWTKPMASDSKTLIGMVAWSVKMNDIVHPS